MNDARHRPRAHRFVIARLDQPGARFVGQVDRDVAVGEQSLELHDEFVDDARDDLRRQMAEGTTASRRLRNSGANRRLTASLSSRSRFARVKPMGVRARSAAPALVVMIRMTLRKSIVLPLWSVSLP